MRRPLLIALLAASAASSGNRAAAQQAQQDRPGASQFQEPAAEQRIDAPDDGTDGGRADRTRSLEERLYLRERPDNLGEASRSFESRVLARLLAQRERLVRVRRDQAVALLDQFVRTEPENAAEMPDALLRLAELRWELAREQYLAAFAAWQRVPESNRGPEPRADFRATMALYDRILQHHRDFDRYDLALYMKAYALLEMGDQDGALVLYRRILEEFPASRFVPDAHFALAEAEFSGNYDYAAALEEYEKVMQYPSSELHDVALFKSAWCLWRLGRSRDAATRFREVLDLGRDRSRMTAAQRRRLRELQDEALDYLIQVFVEDESNTAADLLGFLREIGGERYARRVLARLSDTYLAQARFDRAVEAYKLLLELDPTAPEAPEYQRRIASSYAEMDDTEHTIEALEALAANYGPNSRWAQQQGDPELVERIQRRTERAIRIRALKYHEMAQRDRETKKFESAAQLYGVYLQHFADAPAAYEIQFYRAEILFHRLQRYDEAGDAYLAAARKNPRGRFTRDALYNAIGAFERVREAELERCAPASRNAPPRDRNQPPDRVSTTPAPPRPTNEVTTRCGETENDRKFASAIELYVELFPNDPDLPEILFRQGRLYYDRGVYDPAVRLWGQLLERYPNSQYAAYAGELILDSFNRAQDYANIERWARRLKAAPAFQSAEKQRRLNGLIVQAMFKVGEQLAERGEHAEAADAYFRAAEEFPADARARQAYFNAGVERQRAGDLQGAAEAYDRLIERHPGSSEGAAGAWRAAQMYESIAQFRDAARYYEAYAERFPRGEKATDALYNAVLLRVAAGDNEAAVDAGREFVQQHPRHEAIDEVYFTIGRAHEAAEDWDEAAQVYREYIRRTNQLDRQVEAQTRLAQVLIRADDRRGADRALEEAVRIGKRNQARLQDGLYYAAQARYLQGNQVLAEYEAIRIAGDIAGLRQRLQRKSELLQRASLIYADVAQFEVAEWVTASLYQIGRSYELFAGSMREAPVPDGLNEEEQQSYRDQLEMFVIPMEERALEAYEGGYQKAIQLRIFNRWTQRLREALTRLNDVQYPPLRETGGEIVDVTPIAVPRHLESLQRGGGTRAQRARPTPATPAAPAGETPSAGTTEGAAAPTEAAVTPSAPAAEPQEDTAEREPRRRPARERRGNRRRARSR